MVGCIFEYIFNGKPRHLGSTDQKLVEYGVARFVVNRDIKADEPLALLAATDYFNKEGWDWQHFLADGLSTSNASARGIAFEQAGSYLLGLAFSSPTPLSDVFEFVEENDFGGKEAQLVAIHKRDGELICNPVNLLSEKSTSSYILGYTPRNTDDTLAWLKDPQQTVFCFPAKEVGPDLLLVLMLPDKALIRVVVQFKIGEIMGPSKTEDAARTTDPMQFTSRRTSTQDTKPSQAENRDQKKYNPFLVHCSTSHPLRQANQISRC